MAKVTSARNGVQFSGGGITGEVFRSVDWSRHPLGPVDKWPSALHAALNILYFTKHPMFIFWGPDQICFYNDAYLPSIVGKHPKATGQRGEDCWPEIWNVLKPQIDMVLETGGATWYEEQFLPIYRDDKLEEMWWTYSYSPIIVDDGAIGGVAVIVSNVTAQVLDRKAAADSARLAHDSQAKVLQLLESSVAELRGFFMQAPTPMVILEGSEFRFTLANPPYEKLVGRKALGKTVTEVFAKGEIEQFIPLLEGVFKTGHSFIGKELLLELPDENGNLKTSWVDIGYHPFRADDGTIKGILAIVHDVSEFVIARKKIESNEERVKNERSKLAAIFYGTDSPMVLFRGPELVYEMANEKYLAMIHHRDVIGKTLSEALPEIAESDFPKVIKGVYDTGVPYRFLEGYTPIRNDKTGVLEDRYFDTTFARINDIGNDFLVVGHAMDVTERVQNRKTLEEAKQTAENATNLKSSFLANMSHEIRTPLGAILGFTDLLRDRELPNEQRTQFIDTISRNGKALTRIIDDILDLAKVESGKLDFEKIEFSFFDLIDDVMDVFRERTRAKNIFLRSNLADGIPERIVGDPTRLRQIFLNIVGNAVKFTHEGGVTINVALDEQNSIQKVKVSVKDTGVGMTQEQQDRLFEPFTQADNSTTRKFGGTGLGLALSKRLANALGGDINIEKCGPDEGCTFVFSFGLEVPQKNKAPKASVLPTVQVETKSASLLGKRILVADDSKDNQVLVQLLLRKCGANVDAAENGLIAFRRAMEGSYDVILMDIQMPEMDGYESTRALRDAGYKKPIVALTAHAMAEEHAKSLAAGCTAHLTKPLNMSALVKTILELTNKL